MQSEAALRSLATSYPYDAHEADQLSLSANAGEISEKLAAEIQERLAKAGVEVIEARISHLAYAPEIASAMLQRQQASAIIAARQKIVEGAVSMVEMALEDLAKRDVLDLDEERKAQMVSNLLVVLCADRNPQPILNEVHSISTRRMRRYPWLSEKNSCSELTQSYTNVLHSGQRTTCAASTRKLNFY